MFKKSILIGLLAGALLQVSASGASAAIADPSLGRAAAGISSVNGVRWVCGPYQCAWIPNYRGRVVVYPHMRTWKRPRSPHCIYVRGPFGWYLRCP
jgi:hypothetical protein